MPTGGDGLGDGLQWAGWPETDMAGPTKIQDGVPGVPKSLYFSLKLCEPSNLM